MASDITSRVRKLLELAKSDNEHEAAAAAARAAELMLEHEIELADLEAAKPETEQRVDPAASDILDRWEKRVAWKGVIAYGLASSFGGTMYYHRRGGAVEVVVIAGTSQVQGIRYMYSYLTGEVDRLADRAFAEERAECEASDVEPPSARAWKSAFRIGAAWEIHNRLTEQRKVTHTAAKAAGHGAALMIVDRQADACTAFARRVAPGLFTKSGTMRAGQASSAGASSSAGYNAGKAAGASVNLGGGRRLGSGRGVLKS